MQGFQQLVDHYMPGTIPLNTKIAQGTGEGHFFLMPEDNLVNLAEGQREGDRVDGTEQPVAPVDGPRDDLPEEGSVLNSNPAGVVDAPWVQRRRGRRGPTWIEYLREDEQQQRFMAAGSGPRGTDLDVDPEQFEEWGLDAQPPATTIEPGELAPDVLEQIIDSWGAVKKPSIVTFVVDVSGSMERKGGSNRCRRGWSRIIDEMVRTAQRPTRSAW